MTPALRVGIVAPRFWPFRGGLETYVQSAAEALASQDVDVTVITQAPRAAALPRSETRGDYRIERFDLPLSDMFDVPSLKAVRAAACDGRFDVLWVHSYHTPLAWLVAERATAPLVFTPHYHGVGHTPARHALHWLYRPAGRRLMAACRKIITDTNAEADLVLRDFAREVPPGCLAVVPPPVIDPTSGCEVGRGASDMVLTVARQEPYKRTDLLIRAAAALRDRGTSVRLVVVGDGSALDRHRELVAELGAQDFVTFTGSIDDDELAKWWAVASVYATASQQEAFGIGLAGALVSGLPVVASDIPAHQEVIRRAGSSAAAVLCVSDATDRQAVESYAAALSGMLSSTGLRAERAAQCELPTVSQVGEQFVQILSDVSRQDQHSDAV